jgi:hypothetical protein
MPEFFTSTYESPAHRDEEVEEEEPPLRPTTFERFQVPMRRSLEPRPMAATQSLVDFQRDMPLSDEPRDSPLLTEAVAPRRYDPIDTGFLALAAAAASRPLSSEYLGIPEPDPEVPEVQETAPEVLAEPPTPAAPANWMDRPGNIVDAIGFTHRDEEERAKRSAVNAGVSGPAVKKRLTRGAVPSRQRTMGVTNLAMTMPVRPFSSYSGWST